MNQNLMRQTLDNKTIYRRTLRFSLCRVIWDLLSFILIAGLAAVGFLVADKIWSNGLAGLAVGLILGFVALAIITRFVSYSLKAGQIAMMTRGITEGSLPDDVIGEGKRVVKARFATVTAFFAVTNVIKGIFNQLGRALTNVGEKIGGDTGSAVGSAVSSVIQTVVSYLCDCCLGWVFYRKEVKAAKATCEGAVLFFKHGKTLAKNMGRVFGIGLLSLLVIGGAFAGVIYLVLSSFSASLEPMYTSVAQTFANSSQNNFLINILRDPATWPIFLSVLGGVILWGILHSNFIRPFVLVGVLRNYLESGMDDIPTEDSFALLDARSAKFRKLHNEL